MDADARKPRVPLRIHTRCLASKPGAGKPHAWSMVLTSAKESS
ncbi:hypothetical protein KNP414_04094 [Paenibacillus mucilaginosus KNP414]|uniref:Uncharacterized protein n=1 Tax=Paenibacillus mucilaginosus (strain KNP414) TaxID=1036673 RepID=F8FDR2_PAEMK|nr:hypothetical protein KNP414_04094 [Paenibacillus mucilaginosus KNP414]